MADCTICGEYTKFEGGLCYSCYKKEKKPTADAPKDEKELNELLALEKELEEAEIKEGGLSNRDKNYRYNMIKGRIAETLIQELFLSLNYTVFRYGMENTIPGIMELLRGVRSDVADQIRRMPDFVIQDPRDGHVYFIEVKFRANGSFAFKNLPKDYPYENAYIILVSKKHIKCLTVEELRKGKEITPKSQNFLGKRKEFDLDKDVIIEFCKFAVKFFENVEDPKAN